MVEWKDSRSDQQKAFKVIGPSIADQTVHHDHGKREDGQLEGVEMQRHRLPHDPAQNDHERSNKQGDLQGAADDHSNGQIQLALLRRIDGTTELASITNDRYDDQPDECSAHIEGLDHPVDGLDDMVRADSHTEGGGDKNRTGSPRAQFVGFLLLRFIIGVVEQMGVAFELKVEISEIK